MTKNHSNAEAKVLALHRERMAYLYIRQSSLRQVEQHTEGGRRQYDLVQWLVGLGWPRERIVLVDEDQGKTGTLPDMREGFGRLISAVAQGQVGIVVGLEVSRLARNSPDWHHLMHLCRWTQTLIADEHTIYDLQDSADRMVLGLRGQVSELELDNSIERMVQARWSKARRGELQLSPPAGYELDELGQWVISADESVAQAIALVFAKFDELGSARQVFVWWREQGLKYPVRRHELRSHPVVWLAPKYRMILSTLHHPIYAGVYVFGRSRTVRELDPDNPQRLRVRRVKREEWPVLIEAHHPAYIDFEKFLQNQQRMRNNVAMCAQEGESGVAREGQALLQGLVRCGHCGRGMHVSYGGNRPGQGNRTIQYRCKGTRDELGGGDCQLIGGKRIDAAVVQAFLRVSAPAGMQAAERVNEQARAQHAQLQQQ
jgi:DNA invertase Pin-like site-specific DNA recombinase